MAVGYFAAFSIWVGVRALLFVRYLGVRPPRGRASAGLLLGADVVVLVVSLPGVALVGWIALPVAVCLVFLVIPTAVTWWAVQPLSPPGSPNGSFGIGRGLVWSMAVVFLLFAGTALLFAAFVALSPSGP